MNDREIKEVLLQTGIISTEELAKAEMEAQKLNRPLEKVILDMHLLEKDAFYNLVAEKIGVKYKKIKDIEVAPELLNIYPEELARNTSSLPLFIKDGVLHIVMRDPTNISLIDQIQLFTNYPLEVYLAPGDEVEEGINRLYHQQKVNKSLSGLMEVSLKEADSIVKVVDLIIDQAVKDRASDIHIEPEENVTRVRFRIDGILHEVPSPPKEWEAAIISRIKVLAGMDIAEMRSPQDGHFRVEVGGKVVDCRVSTLPTVYGENVVLRLLDPDSVKIGLERLGFTTYDDLRRYEELISKPYGILLSTGPTGCGKTTTLYSALMRINTPDKNIVTLEDPVEYRLGLIRQVQVNPKAGITFATGLRAILRQDPDVIMVGEIRDWETAKMAVQAALTGHLVFSTLHTNDAPSSVARLIDMKIEPFLVSASLIGVMAQRLVRLICPQCKEPYRPSKAVLKQWGLQDRDDLVVYRGKGCPNCRGTGYYGRTGIFELMVVDDEIKEMIMERASTVALRKKAQEKGMRLLWEDGREKVLKGLVTFEEVARVCEELVEVRPIKTEVKPQVFSTKETGKGWQKEVKVNPQALEEYKEKITRWFSRK